MSPSWASVLPQTWRIGIATDRVDALRLRAFSRSVVAARAEAPVADAPGPLHERLAAALDAALVQARPGRGAATLVLSNDLVHYAVLPWQAEVQRPSEVAALARLAFEQQLGAEAAAACTLRCHEGGWGQPVLACAVDSALVDALRSALAGHGLKLASLQPLLMAAANGLRARLADDAALAIVERERLTLARWRAGHPVEVASRRAGAAPAAVLAQELALSEDGAPQRPVDLLLVGAAARWNPAADGGAPRVNLLAPTPGPLALAGLA